MLDLLIDYNAETEDGQFFVRASRFPAAAVGERLRTHDEDGSSLEVVVTAVDPEGIVLLEPDWSTWADDTPSADDGVVPALPQAAKNQLECVVIYRPRGTGWGYSVQHVEGAHGFADSLRAARRASEALVRQMTVRASVPLVHRLADDAPAPHDDATTHLHGMNIGIAVGGRTFVTFKGAHRGRHDLVKSAGGSPVRVSETRRRA